MQENATQVQWECDQKACWTNVPDDATTPLFGLRSGGSFWQHWSTDSTREENQTTDNQKTLFFPAK